MKIPIILVNATLRFPTTNPKKFTFKTYEKRVTKGKTPEQAFQFLRVNKTNCDMYCIQPIKVVGKTSVIDN